MTTRPPSPPVKPYSNAAPRGRLRETVSLVRYKLATSDRMATVKKRSFDRIQEKVERHLGALRDRTVVEVGCGQLLANVKMLAAMGNRVIGIDPEVPPQSLADLVRFFGSLGFERTAKSLINALFFRRAFDRGLERLSGLSFRGAVPTLHRGGAEHLPLDDQSADVCISDNVFEHLADVPAVVSEIRRVLRPGGVACIVIHPFAAYSGGHNLDLVRVAGEACPVAPWDHLRQNRNAAGVYLNRLREHEYRAIFEGALETLEWERLGPEGEEHLTDEILAELHGYTRDELLTGKLVYVGRR